MSANRIIKALEKYTKFLITSHIDLEGDALGSELALASLLRKLGKSAYVVNSGPVPANYNFLPGTEKIRHKLNQRRFQAAFIIDCSTRDRIGNVSQFINQGHFIINIDHHLGNERFGQINWIDPKASCAGEMIYRLFKLTQTKLDKKDALNIYAAILTDTGSFRHANTTSTTLRIASELLKYGIDPAEVYARIYENNSADEVDFVGRMISQISFAANNKIAWIKIGQDKFKKIKGKSEIFDKILELVKCIGTVKVILLFRQQDNQLVKVSLRSRQPIDVQKIARVWGGGGHRLASGCTIKGNLQEVEQMVIKEVKKIIKPN